MRGTTCLNVQGRNAGDSLSLPPLSFLSFLLLFDEADGGAIGIGDDEEGK